MHRLMMLLVALAVTAAVSAADLTLVLEGAPKARVLLPDAPADPAKAAADPLTAAANTFVDCIRTSSGAELSIVRESEAKAYPGVTIALGATALAKAAKLPPKGLDDDGFVISAKGNTIIIVGPTDWGSEFGLYDVLERFVGVRWLLPGDNGTDVPAHKTLKVPEGLVRDEPVFMSRLFSGLRGPAQNQWARCNRMHGKISFHHSLGENIFKPEKYKADHPEFFPMKDGKTRYLPADGMYHGWQPCFSAPGTVEVAVQTICEYFKANPEAPSFSLGVNDSSGHCRCPECLARIPEQKNFLGMYDYSDIYYDWCNKVIEGVLKQYPDKWFGCLAYSEVAAPPTKVKVHERLIPYMTYDRMKWIHPEIEKSGHEATEAWHKASPTLGWYDYIYGTPYCLPRVWFHKSGEYLKYGQQQGVKAHYAEIYPNWGEGPKPYLFMKLWWNPNQDVDKLLNEWYVRCVGAKAAPDLARYYAIWERFWTKDILNSKWFSVPGGQYCNFGHPGYLADVKPEDIAESRRLLDRVIANCATADQKARAELLERAFQYYEASALAYLANENTPSQLDTEEQALAALRNSATGMAMAHKRQYLAMEVFPKDPVLVNPLSLDRFPALKGDTWGGNGVWAVMDWVMKGDNAVRRQVMEYTKSDSPLLAQQAQFMLSVADGTTELLSANPSFAEGKGTASTGWTYWVKGDGVDSPPCGKMLRAEDFGRTDKTSLLCDGMARGGPVQTVKFSGPGKYLAMAWVYVPENQNTPRGTAELALTPLDDKGQNLQGFSAKIIPTPGQWKLLVVGGDIAEKIGEKTVGSLRVVPIVDSFKDGKVYWDDVSLHRLQ
ncbi:MAG: DUF4838 domain-containing protein [Armatimonadia bacterium]